MASLYTTLNQLHNGSFAGKASDALTQLVEAVEETGKAGHLTITIAVKPTQGSRRTLTVAGKIQAKIPEIPVDATLMFTDEEGGLHTEDPRQQRLDLQPVVSARPATLESVAS